MARKKKKGPVSSPGSKKKKKKKNPIQELIQTHPEFSKEQAKEIVESGLSVEEWKEKQEQEKQKRLRKKQEGMIRLLCSQHPRLRPEQAREIIEQKITPEEYFQQQRQKRKPHFSSKNKFKKRKPRIPPKKLERQRKIERIQRNHPDIPRAVAGQIVSGNITIEKFLQNLANKNKQATFRTSEEIEHAQRLRLQRKEELANRVEKESHLGFKGDNYLQQLIETKANIEILRFHAPSFQGHLLSVEPFLFYLHTEKQPKLKLVKRYCALLFEQEKKQEIQEAVLVSPQQLALKQYPHREPSRRTPIPDEHLRAGEMVHILLHNGLYISGTLKWCDRFQVLVTLQNDSELFIFRHSMYKTSQQELEFEEELFTIHEFLIQNPDLPKVHPEVLPPEDIEIPKNFDDFPVEDQLYEKYEQAFEEGKFSIQPISVRREDTSYVLVDGYRRVTLAKSRGIPALPIVVV